MNLDTEEPVSRRLSQIVKNQTCFDDANLKLENANKIIDSLKLELKENQLALSIMGEKLIDQIEKSAELQHSTESVQSEIENLTKSLFEEANSLVSTEAKKRHLHETREKSLELQLKELQIAHANDLDQLNQLKAVLSSIGSETSITAPVSINIEIDPVALANFKDFYSSCQSLPIPKLFSTTLFLKNAYIDDLEPTLRFPNKQFIKKIIENIQNNTIIIQEMNSQQVNSHLLNTIQPKEKESTYLSQIAYNFQKFSTGLSPNPLLSSCSLCTLTIDPIHHFKLDSIQSLYPICKSCRKRLVLVCEFYSIVRNIVNGLYIKRNILDVWWEFVEIKAKMFWARSGTDHESMFRRPRVKEEVKVKEVDSKSDGGDIGSERLSELPADSSLPNLYLGADQDGGFNDVYVAAGIDDGQVVERDSPELDTSERQENVLVRRMSLVEDVVELKD